MALPSDPIIARHGPWLMELDNAMITAGPGVSVTSMAIKVKLSQSFNETKGELSARPTQQGLQDSHRAGVVFYKSLGYL